MLRGVLNPFLDNHMVKDDDTQARVRRRTRGERVQSLRIGPGAVIEAWRGAPVRDALNSMNPEDIVTMVRIAEILKLNQQTVRNWI